MQWLKRMEEARDVPVIIISGQDPAKYREQTAKLGAVAFMSKPIKYAPQFGGYCAWAVANGWRFSGPAKPGNYSAGGRPEVLATSIACRMRVIASAAPVRRE